MLPVGRQNFGPEHTNTRIQKSRGINDNCALKRKERMPNQNYFFPGAFSRKAFEKIGFVPRSEVNYRDFEDEGGKRVFAEKDMGPHKCTTLLTKDLSPKE